ncbi:unnamed protein product, partial [Durusdinium trenchii]
AMGEDGTAGWFSIRDRQAAAPGVSAHGPSGMKTGTVFAEAEGKFYTCVATVALADG